MEFSIWWHCAKNGKIWWKSPTVPFLLTQGRFWKLGLPTTFLASGVRGLGKRVSIGESSMAHWWCLQDVFIKGLSCSTLPGEVWVGGHGKVLNKVVVVVANKNGIKHGTKQDGTGKPCFCLPNLGSKLPHTKRIWQRIRSCWEKIGPQIVLFFWWKVPFQERFQCLSDPGLLGG